MLIWVFMSLKSTGERNRAVHNNSTVAATATATNAMTVRKSKISFESNILARANCVRNRVQPSRHHRKKQKKRKTNKTENGDSNEKESIFGAQWHTVSQLSAVSITHLVHNFDSIAMCGSNIRLPLHFCIHEIDEKWLSCMVGRLSSTKSIVHIQIQSVSQATRLPWASTFRWFTTVPIFSSKSHWKRRWITVIWACCSHSPPPSMCRLTWSWLAFVIFGIIDNFMAREKNAVYDSSCSLSFHFVSHSQLHRISRGARTFIGNLIHFIVVAGRHRHCLSLFFLLCARAWKFATPKRFICFVFAFGCSFFPCFFFHLICRKLQL